MVNDQVQDIIEYVDSVVSSDPMMRKDAADRERVIGADGNMWYIIVTPTSPMCDGGHGLTEHPSEHISMGFLLARLPLLLHPNVHSSHSRGLVETFVKVYDGPVFDDQRLLKQGCMNQGNHMWRGACFCRQMRIGTGTSTIGARRAWVAGPPPQGWTSR